MSRPLHEILDGFEEIAVAIRGALPGINHPLGRRLSQQIVDLRDYLAAYEAIPTSEFGEDQ